MSLFNPGGLFGGGGGGGGAPDPHTHPIPDVTGLSAALDGKAAASHGHAIADVTGLSAALDGKAAASHGHAIADTGGLQAALDAKAPLASPALTGTATAQLLRPAALQEKRVALGSGTSIDLAAGNVFTRTISGAVTLGVANVPAAGTVASFVLDLTNGGSAAITWWSGLKWPGGSAPTLTASGRDILGFITHDGGATWSGMLLARDVR